MSTSRCRNQYREARTYQFRIDRAIARRRLISVPRSSRARGWVSASTPPRHTPAQGSRWQSGTLVPPDMCIEATPSGQGPLVHAHFRPRPHSSPSLRPSRHVFSAILNGKRFGPLTAAFRYLENRPRFLWERGWHGRGIEPLRGRVAAGLFYSNPSRRDLKIDQFPATRLLRYAVLPWY